MKSTQGSSLALITAVIAVVVIVGGIIYFNIQPEGEQMMREGEETMQDGEIMMEEGEAMMKEGEKMMEEGEAMMGDESMQEGDTMMEEGSSYTGEVLAGSTDASPLLVFNQQDYEQALSSGKLVTFYFYANWCPVCREEFPKMQAVFNNLSSDQVVGFRVNFNDNKTNKNEEQLAREFGVAYQHTKVFLKDGERVLKSPESWEQDRYRQEINYFISQ